MATDVKLASTAIVTPRRTVAACAPGTNATGASISTSATRSPTSLNSSPRAWIRPVRRASAPSSRLRMRRAAAASGTTIRTQGTDGDDEDGGARDRSERDGRQGQGIR